MTKVCCTCEIKKPITKFHKSSREKDGHKRRCKECRKKLEKQPKEYYKKYYKKNIEKKKQYNRDNREKRSELYKKWYEKNKNYRKEYMREYRKKYFEIPKNRINKRISNMILKSLRKNKKGYHWEDILGYTVDDLIKHLESTSCYTIEECTEKNLQIDHIIPVSCYNFSSFEDENFRRCWDLRNLRLLSADKNYDKRAKIDFELIEKIGIYDLLPI